MQQNINGDLVPQVEGSYIYGFYMDEHNQIIERTPSTHPYSYDSYILWRNLPNDQMNASAYSDRMMQWNYKKFDELWKKHGLKGQYWYASDKDKIEAFIKDYFEKPNLKVVYVMQCCNQATGFPLWFVAYNTGDENGS
jgi:hypothetical protein